MFFKNRKAFIVRFAAILVLLGGVWGTTTVQAELDADQPPLLAVGETVRVTNGLNGDLANGFSTSPTISADGRYIAFLSLTSNLVPDDTNAKADVFVYDLQLSTVTRVSVASNGAEANLDSYHPMISADGRYVTFASQATNLVPGDTNGRQDIFVHDLQTGVIVRASLDSLGAQWMYESNYPDISADGRYVAFEVYGGDIWVHDMQTGSTTRASVDSNGVPGNRNSNSASISADGRYVAFSSSSSNLVATDANGERADIFVHDMQTGQTTLVSLNSSGEQANESSEYPSISADGRYVAMTSWASNLVPGDTGWRSDVFVHDRQTGITTRVSVDSNGVEANAGSNSAVISADGHYVTFLSSASNLVSDDTNNASDAFVHDTLTGGTSRVSVGSNGTQANHRWAPSSPAPISADGQYIAFDSDATNLVEGDNSNQDIFVHRQSVPPLPPTITPTITDTPTFTPTVTLTDTPTFTPTYTPTNTATFTPTPTFTATATPPYSYAPLYLSLASSQTIGGVSAADEDILYFDGTNWSLFFDGSDVGVSSPDLVAFSFLDADTILMVFSTNVIVNGMTATPQDILRFDAASLGSTTAGTFSLYFDGSDVGLTTSAENIDALTFLPEGRILLSTTGNPSVTGVSAGRDEDVLLFTAASLGSTTSGTWLLYFDGSDVGLGESSDEDIEALDIVGEDVYLSTLGAFSVSGLSGADEDVFVCTATALGDVTACSYSPALYFDGSTWGLTGNDVDAFHSSPLPYAGTPSPQITVSP